MSNIAFRSKRRIPKPKRARSAQRKPRPAPVSHAPLPDATAGAHDRDAPHLSRREREIVALLIGGRSVKEAAAALGLSPRTLEGYLERLKRRFRHPRLLSLVVHLVKQGLVE